MGLLQLRDQDIFTHSNEVSVVAAAIAREVKATQKAIFPVSIVALLHDLGKIALPDALNARP